jgi:[ribosomal protein S5]-alanine N-acetyltransferase
VARWHWPVQLGSAPPREQVREMLTHQARQYDEVGYCIWWWRERDTGLVVGEIGLNRTEIAGEAAVEIGWSISPEHWNRGLATEAAEATLAFAFEDVGLDEVVSFTMVTNAASRRVMEKLGMRFDRELEHHSLPHVLYRLRREEWQGANRAR